MHDPVKDPKYWRARAHATRAKAKRCYEGREIRRMLRVAEEYDKMADRAQEWQRGKDTTRVTLSQSLKRPSATE